MKKIIIVSEIFAPQNRIAAIRLTKLAKYFSRNFDCEITVVTRDKVFEVNDKFLMEDAQCINKYIKVSENKLLAKIADIREKRGKQKKQSIASTQTYKGKKRRKLDSFKHKLIETLKFSLELISNMSYFYQGRRKIKKLNESYDVILSSYGPFSSHYIGRYLKKVNHEAIWIADFRDPVYHLMTPFGFRGYSKKYARRLCKDADVITTVSDGCLDSLYITNLSNKYILTNGYDREDISRIQVSHEKSSRMKFLYVGTLYPGRSNLNVVFKAIRELINENLILPNNIEIVYAGPSMHEFSKQVNQYGLRECTIINDKVPREKSIQMQLKSNVLLLASWNKTDSTGIITGKFFEYMMIEKPVICTISGNIPNSNLKEMINKANIGVCFEEASSDEDYLKLKSYILTLYNDFIEDGNIKLNPNYKYINEFDYDNLAKQFGRLMQL